MTPFIIIGTLLFCIGLYGALKQKEMLRIFISIEIMIAASNLILIALVVFLAGGALGGVAEEQFISSGLVLLFFVWLFAIANAAVGLPLLLLIRRITGADRADELSSLKG